MKNFTKRVVALFLTLAMLMPLVCVYPFALSATDMADYSEEHWAAEALKWAVDYNLIKGYEDGTIRPDANLTRAEMATVINRAFGATILADISKFVDVDINDWFYEEAAKAVNMGTFEGNEHKEFLPNDYIRREEAFAVIARALVLEGGKVAELERFGDADKVSDWAKELLADLAERKYINGSPVENQEKNNLYPRENITRAEFAQLLYNIFLEIINVTPVKGKTYDGNVLINYNQGDLVIENVTIKGDLIIADGVGLNSVTLKNVKVEGRIVVRGGKLYQMNSVTVGECVVVCNNNTTVNFDNYKTEAVFNNASIKTPATFKKPSSSSGGTIVVGPSVTKAKYTVQYYLENLDGTFALKEEITYNGTIGNTIDGTNDSYKYDEKTFTGFTFDAANANNVTSGKVASNDSLVLKFYYIRVRYNVTFNYNGTKDADGNDSSVVEIKYQATKDYINFPAVTRNGYTFDGWYDQEVGGKKLDTENVVFDDTYATTYYAQWIANGDTRYKLIVKYQNVADDDYDDYEEFPTLTGTTDTTITVADAVNSAIAKEGYVIPEGFKLVNGKYADTILGDRSLVITAYFDRIVSTVTFDYNGGKDANDATFTTSDWRYGYTNENIVYPAEPKKDGYTFDGWYTEADGGVRVDNDSKFVFDKTEATTYYAHWITDGDTDYKLTIKYQNVSDDGYNDYVEYPLTGTTDAVISVTDAVNTAIAEKGYVIPTGFELINGGQTATILGDGTLEIVAYFNRIVSTVTFDYNGGKDADNNTSSSVKLRYGADLILPDDVTRVGYISTGWYNEKNGYPAPAKYEEIEATTYYIEWAAGDTTYTIRIFKMDVNGNYPTDPEESKVPAFTGDEVKIEDTILENGGLLIDDSKPNVLKATVKGDGTTVLVAYYKRMPCDVTFATPDGDIVETVLYGGTLAEDKFEWVYYSNNSYSYYDEVLDKTYKHMEDDNFGVKNAGWVEVIDEATETYGEEYFTPETVVTADIRLAPEYKLLVLKADWTNSSLDFTIGTNNAKSQTFEAAYNDETRAIDTAKDILIKKATAVNEIIDKLEDKGYDDKALGKLDMILDGRNIRHFEFEVNTVKVLGADELKEEIHKEINDDPDEIDVEHKDIVEVIDELLDKGSIHINSDEKLAVMKKFLKKVNGLDYEENVKSHIPEFYKKLMSEEDIIDNYESAKEQIETKLETAISNYEANPDDEEVKLTAFSNVLIKTDLIGDLVVPKYDVARDKFTAKYEEKVGEALSPEMERILDILDPEAFLDYDDAHVSYEDGLSGYSLKENKFYYEVVQKIAVLGDEAGKTLQAKAEEKGFDAEEIANEFADFVTGYMTTINDYLDKYVDELIEKGYDALGKKEIDIVEKYKDKRLTEDYIEKARKALVKAINGYDTTTDEAFDLAVKAADKAMGKDKIENAVDKYTQDIMIENDLLGVIAKDIEATLTRTKFVLY